MMEVFKMWLKGLLIMAGIAGVFVVFVALTIAYPWVVVAGRVVIGVIFLSLLAIGIGYFFTGPATRYRLADEDRPDFYKDDPF